MAKGVYRKHQRRTVAFIRAVEAKGEVETDTTIPESSRGIDMMLRTGEPDPAWGVLQQDVGWRTVLIEHFSKPPSACELGTVFLKAAWGLEQWLCGKWTCKRPPLTLVLSVGCPRSGLDRLRELRPSDTLGVYRTREALLEVVLANVRGIPPGSGRSFLRLFDHRPEVVEANHERLRSDPTVGKLVRERISEAIMAEPRIFDPNEYYPTYQEAVAEGVEKGLKKGREEMLEIARACLAKELVKELSAIDELNELRARLVELLPGNRRKS
ncbi:hypothetical protein ACFL59_14135 [Planctomycetota bacterium]